MNKTDRYQITTISDFRRFVKSLVETEADSFKGSLEKYLRSLWGLIQKHKDSSVSYGVLGQLLAEGFTAQPVPFDDNWLRYDAPPEELRARDLKQVKDDYDFVRKMILYQIADLHQMKSAGLLDKSPQELYFGIDSPTGYRWYNFHPASYLDCASQSLMSDSEHTECNWSDLAIFLWLGQIYE